MDNDKVLIGFITNKDEAANIELAGKLLENNLVACSNIIPAIKSIYRWEGKVCNDTESLMIIKTMQSKTDAVIECVRANHSYEVMEVIFTDVVNGYKPYLDWVQSSTSSTEK